MSNRLTSKALAAGHEVVIFSRGNRAVPGLEGAQRILGDREQLRQHSEALHSFDPEVVVDSICFHPDRARDLVDLFPRVHRAVLVSTVDVYGEEVGGEPVTEERTPEPVTGYAQNKLECESVVMKGFGARATVVRPSHILGSTFLTASLWGRSPHWVDRIRKGKSIPIIDGGRNLVTPVHAADAAEWILRTFDSAAADGQVLNAVGGNIIPQLRYMKSIAVALGTELRVQAIPSPVFQRYFDAPTQFSHHRPYSGAKAQRLLGYAAQATPESMMKETVEHMLAQNLVRDCSEEPLDDVLIDLMNRQEQELGQLLASKPFAAKPFASKSTS